MNYFVRTNSLFAKCQVFFAKYILQHIRNNTMFLHMWAKPCMHIISEKIHVLLNFGSDCLHHVMRVYHLPCWIHFKKNKHLFVFSHCKKDSISSLHGQLITRSVVWEMKLPIHTQTSKATPLNFANGLVNSLYSLKLLWSLVHATIVMLVKGGPGVQWEYAYVCVCSHGPRWWFEDDNVSQEISIY